MTDGFQPLKPSLPANATDVRSHGAPTIDDLIDWLHRTRQIEPDKPLAELLQSEFKPAAPANWVPRQVQLIDLACIDLIQQRRADRDVVVEDYLLQFPSLDSPAAKLDLIDAEWCVRGETQSDESNQPDHNRQDIARFKHRFAELADEIEQLVAFAPSDPTPLSPVGSLRTPTPVTPVHPNQTVATELLSRDTSSFDINADQGLSRGVQSPVAAPNRKVGESHWQDTSPIETPDWFVQDECVCGGPERWLIRGRDADRGTMLLLKIIKLPAPISSEDADRVLDECERAAKVFHPVWVAPILASIQNRHFAVFRPWEFANPWQPVAEHAQMPSRLRQLATVAYALQSAHRTDAYHRSVHSGNVLVDHQDQIRLVDAGSSMRSLAKHFGDAPGGHHQDDQPAWQRDTKDLIKLILVDVVDCPGQWDRGLHERLIEIMENHQAESCGIIGDELSRRADRATGALASPPDNGTAGSWRRRLARWINQP
ncbi:MAG: hypothetical protein HKN47_22770 [Pirellulaceae bacterium]|nr:hypothetical protein [Pirellulaceae bacterium]